MKKVFQIVSLFFFSFAWLSCSSNSHDNRAVACEATEEYSSIEEAAGTGDVKVQLPVNLKLERSADVSIDSKCPTQCRGNVDSLMARYGGYLENESYHKARAAYYLTLRIPAASLDSFLTSLSGVEGSIVDKNISVVDRTTEYCDWASRKQSNDAMLQRYREMLKQATKVSDMLEIQARIDQIQMDADCAQGRMNRIDKDVNFSVVKIDIKDKSIKVDDGSDDSFTLGDFGEAIVNGWHGIVAVIWFLFNIWPLWIVAAAVIYFVKRRMRNQ